MAVNNKAWFEGDKRFINPYNFVSLGDGVNRSEVQKGNLTGNIKVSLYVKTPLAIPDSENVTETIADNKTDKHSVYGFLRAGDTPIIPGSQLRGMVRNAYETLSNSCMSVNNNNILSARHANAGKAGIVQFKGGEWCLFDARTYKDKGQTLNPATDVRRTWYDISGANKTCKVFSNTDNKIECVNLDRAIENYLENIKIYDADKTAFKKFKADLTYGIKKDGRIYPVFYEIVEYEGKKYVYLSPAQMGRYVFDNRLDDILESYASCSKDKGECLCKACNLFGMISTVKKGKSHAGKVRFSDAHFIEFDSTKGNTLKELAEPKITSVEYYSKRPEKALYWTYDYKIISYDKIKTGRFTESIPNKEKCDIEIRGRKFYLHNPKLKPTDYTTSEKTKRNSTMELCKSGSKCTFDIYFEKITDDQLRELIWAINIGENDENGKQMHKLGHGKPLGLGSVKLVVDEVNIRNFDSEKMSYNIESKKAEDYMETVPFDTESIYFKEYMQITDFYGLEDAMKKKSADVCYPVADDGKGSLNSKASHQWFIANRSMGENGTTTSWSIKYALPKITSKNPTMPSMEKREIGSTNMSGNKKNNIRNKNENNESSSSYSSGSSGIKFGSIMSKEERYKKNDKSKKRK